MGNGMYWWSKYEGRRSNGERGRRPKGRGVGPGWTPVMPLEAKDGFFANYKWYLALSTGTLLFSLFVLVSVGETFFLLGGGAPFYFFLVLAGIFMGLALPPFWYARHRRMRRIIDASDDELGRVVEKHEARRGFVRRNMALLLTSGIVGAAAWSMIAWIVWDGLTNGPLGPATMGSFGLGYSAILLAAAFGSIALPIYRWTTARRLDRISSNASVPVIVDDVEDQAENVEFAGFAVEDAASTARDRIEIGGSRAENATKQAR